MSSLKFSNRSGLVLFLSFAVVFVSARLWRLAASCLWFDEIFSVHAARHDWSGLLNFVAADIIHPPLFYALLKVWIGLGGESLTWLRLLPALIAIASLIPFTLLCRELKLKTSELNFALLLLAANGYLIKYAQEVRMYSLLCFLSICSLWLFFKLFNRDNTAVSTFIALFAINLMMVYSHYAGWIVVFLEVVVLLLWQRRRLVSFLLSAALLLLAYAPWVYLIFKVNRLGTTGGGVAQNIGWVAKPGIFDLVQYFVLLNRPFLFVQSNAQTGYNVIMALIATVLFGLPLLALFWRLFAGKETEKHSKIYALIVFLLAPAMLAFLFSWVSPHSVWGTRHLIIASAPYAILAAVAINLLRPFFIRITTLVVIGCWLFLSAAVFFASRQQDFIWCSWEQLGRQVEISQLDSRQPVQIYAYEDLVAYHLWFALNGAPNQQFKVAVIKGVPGIPEDPAYFLPRAFTDISVLRNEQMTGDNIWIAFRSTRWDDTRPPLNLIRQSGFEVGQVFSMKAQGQQAFLVQLRKK